VCVCAGPVGGRNPAAMQVLPRAGRVPNRAWGVDHSGKPCRTPIGTPQIGESFKRFGVGDDTHHLLVARFNAAPEDVSRWCSAPVHSTAPHGAGHGSMVAQPKRSSSRLPPGGAPLPCPRSWPTRGDWCRAGRRWSCSSWQTWRTAALRQRCALVPVVWGGCTRRLPACGPHRTQRTGAPGWCRRLRLHPRRGFWLFLRPPPHPSPVFQGRRPRTCGWLGRGGCCVPPRGAGLRIDAAARTSTPTARDHMGAPSVDCVNWAGRAGRAPLLTPCSGICKTTGLDRPGKRPPLGGVRVP
jgi:hypothetical protein